MTTKKVVKKKVVKKTAIRGDGMPYPKLNSIKALTTTYYDYQLERQALDNRLGKKKNGEDKKNRVPMDDEMLLVLESRRQMIWEFEEETKKQIEAVIVDHPLWKNFLCDVNGCGPVMTAVLISEIDIYKAEMASQIVSYAGIATGETRGKKWNKKKKKIIVTDTMIPIDRKTKKFLCPYNQTLKSRLLGVLAGQFLQVHGKSYSPYAEIYYNRRKRRENMDWGTKSPNPTKKKKPKAAHQHADARRYMIKMFLIDLYVAWRTIEGLSVREPYEEEYLGKVHHTKKKAV